MKFIRWILGRIILTVDFLTSPRPVTRKIEDQNTINDLTVKMSLYQFKACPFCVKVRRHFKRNALNIATKDAKGDAFFKDELTLSGGRYKVPCLRIDNGPNDTIWLYESEKIIAYLNTELKLS